MSVTSTPLRTERETRFDDQSTFSTTPKRKALLKYTLKVHFKPILWLQVMSTQTVVKIENLVKSIYTKDKLFISQPKMHSVKFNRVKNKLLVL